MTISYEEQIKAATSLPVDVIEAIIIQKRKEENIPFTETMITIANIFNFDATVVPFEALEQYFQALRANDTEQINDWLDYLHYETKESALMRCFVDLYFKSEPFIEKGEKFVYIVEDLNDTRVYNRINNVAVYLNHYYAQLSGPDILYKLFLQRFNHIKPARFIN